MAAKKGEKSEKPQTFKEHLAEIAQILEWFDSQEEIDVEEALEKIKKASGLIAASKQRLGEIENEFKEIKKSVASEGE